MKIFKQLIGYSLLIAFIGSLMYKFNNSVSDIPGSEFIVLLAVFIVIILLFGISKIPSTLIHCFYNFRKFFFKIMKAVYYETFGGPISVKNVPFPKLTDTGVILKVKASGLCRSDWHGWMGHDPDIHLPHVPGHELAGIIEEVGSNVKSFKKGDRVTLPFVCGCGTCRECQSGNHQVCDHQFQPGFTHWGSFAEFVGINYAETNLVKLPESIDFENRS